MVKRTLIKASLAVFLVGLFLISGLTEASAGRRLTVNSPLTQLLANGFTADQVVDLLADAGISGLKKNDVYKDPMEGLAGLETFTDDDVRLLQAATAVNLFLLRLDNFSWGPGDDGDLACLDEAVHMVKSSLSEAGYQGVSNQLGTTLADFNRPLTIDHLIRATNNYLETLSVWARSGEITDPVTECGSLMDSLPELALHYYVQENRGHAAIEEAIGYDILPDINGTQYPQIDFSGLVTIYNQDGSVASSDLDPTSETDPVAYPAPILNSVVVDGSSFVLSWSLPDGVNEVPSGGYDVVIDGVDTGTQWRTTDTGIVVSGLEPGASHTFQVQARWLQADPDETQLSNEISAAFEEVSTVSEPSDYPAPILDSAEVDGNNFVLTWSLPDGTSEIPSGGYDIIIDGTDTGTEWRTTGTTIVITGLEAGVSHTFQVQARWLQADPDQVPLSNELSAVISLDPPVEPEPTTYPAPTLDDVNVDGSNFVLNWSLPAGTSEVPSGGYDIVIDGVDTGTEWRTTQTNIVITGLEVGVTHTFQVQARWLQADPHQVPLSNELSGVITVNSLPVPEPTTYPAPTLDDVNVDGSNFVLNWSLPAGTSDVPSGGYDIIIDGTDTGTDWRTTQTSTVITGLSSGAAHTFQIQARWLQVDPHQVPLSNELSGTIPADTSGGDLGSSDAGSGGVEPPTSSSGAVKAFPGAVGFGTETVAGRGGQIIKVTNLNDSGSGSLRAAIEASGARTIVFEVGGAINLSSDLRLSNGYCTIAGQTAPFPGIMLKGAGIRITASNILMQHIAIRVGDDGRSTDGSADNADAVQIIGSGCNNIVIDHCSWSWAIDENSSAWASNAHDITFSNNIIGEALVSSVHTEGSHSKGLLIGGSSNNPKRVAIIGNLFAHNVDRNPQLKGGTSTVIANNVMYNCGDSYSISNMTRNYVSEKTLASYLGNIFIDGPQSASGAYAIKAESNLASGSAFYASDNVNLSRPNYLIKDSAGCKVSSPPLSISDYSPLPSGSVIDSVLAYTGARPAQRDDVDARLVVEVVNGTGSRKNHSSGLWPSYPQASRDFDQYIPANPNGDDDGDGYTNIEEVLASMARQVEGR